MTPTQQSQTPLSGQHAVVIGGSMAGLLATRVLSEHFAQVTLVERDRLPQRAEPRKGVPQGRHIHGLLIRGEQILSQFFPDLVPALLEAGATRLDMGEDFRWHHFGVWKAHFHSGLSSLSVSRPLLEWQINRRVTGLSNVQVIEECTCTRFTTGADQTRVTGVQIQRRAGAAPEESLGADLVVDASGRGSHTPRWLETLGYAKPEESTIPVSVGYATRLYRRPQTLPDWKALYVVPQPPTKRGGGIFPIEDDRWMVTLFGWLGDHPAPEEHAYLDFARSISVPDVYRAIEQAEPLTSIEVHKFPSNLRRHYEKLSRFPEGLIVLGDALCSFNPVYGQGMTISAMEALTLDGCLREQHRTRGTDLIGLWRRFQTQVAKVVDVPWQLTTGEDFRYSETEGRRPVGTAFMHWYTGKMHRAASHHAQVAQRFYQVMHMLESPAVLFHPGVMFRLLGTPSRAVGH
jgi:2-polyprenyl-6-methoxyphenol hydroxylase-like FAD-dependent oxidoreductase